MTSSNDTRARPAGRPREFDTAKALDDAIVLFSERGFAGTSVTDLTEATGLTAGSLYKAFADKRGFFAAALARYMALGRTRWQAALGREDTARQRLAALIGQYAESSAGASGRRGCLVVGTAVALSTADAGTKREITQAIAANETDITRLIHEGQVDGSIAATVDAKATARLLVCMLLGMRVLGKAGRSLAEMRPLVTTALRLLD